MSLKANISGVFNLSGSKSVFFSAMVLTIVLSACGGGGGGGGNPGPPPPPQNRAPVADAQSVRLDLDTNISITLTATDPDGDSLTYALATQPANGSLSGDAPDVTYTPNQGYSGTDSFTFTANDGSLTSAEATIDIIVNGAPVAEAQSLQLDQGTSIDITLAATDPNSDALDYVIVQQPANGAISGTLPNITYTPNLEFVGVDTFTFNATDGSLTSEAATVELTVVAADVVDEFDFQDIPEALADSLTESESIRFDVLNFDAAISVDNGEYSINSHDFTTEPGTLSPGDRLRLRLLSSATRNETVSMTVTIDGQQDSFSVTTSGDETAPTVAFTFPQPGHFTKDNQVTLSGTTQDNGTVYSVSVNGVNATSSNNFQNWSVTVPVVLGDNSYSAVATDLGNNQSTNDATTTIKGLLDIEADQLAFNTNTNEVLMFASGTRTLASFDVQTNTATPIFSPGSHAQNPSVGRLADMSFDAASNRAYLVSTNSLDVIYETDVTTGTTNIFTEDENDFPEHLLVEPNHVSYDAANELLYILDSTSAGRGRRGVLIYDINANRITTLVAPASFNWTSGMALDSGRNQILVTDNLSNAIYSVDLPSGETTRLSLGGSVQPADYFNIVIDDENNRALMMTRSLGVVALDLNTLELTQAAPNATIDNISTFANTSLVYDSQNDRLFFMVQSQNTIYELDLNLNTASVFSSNTVPNTDNAFFQPRGMTLDTANNRLLVTSSAQNSIQAAVIAVSLDDGSRTIISDDVTPNSDNLMDKPGGLVLVNGNAIVVDSGLDAVFSVNMTTGAREILTSNNVIDENATFVQLTSVYDDVASDRLLVTDPGQQRLFAIDKSTQERSVVSAPGLPDNTNLFAFSEDMIIENGRGLVLERSLIYSVNLVTGERTLFSGAGVPNSDNELVAATSFALDEANNRLLVTNGQAIIAVSLTDGSRSIFSDASTSNGELTSITLDDITIDTNRNKAIVTDDLLRYTLAVDLTSGEREIYHGSTHPNQLPLNPFDMVFDEANNRYLIYSNLRNQPAYTNIMSVQADTGARSLIWTPEPINNIFVADMVLDSPNNRLLVIDDTGLYSIDLATGEQIEIVDTVNTDSDFNELTSLAYDSQNNRVFVTDIGLASVWEIALTTGERTLRYQGEEEFNSSFGLAYDEANDRLIIVLEDHVATFNLASESYQVLSDSRDENVDNAVRETQASLFDFSSNRLLVSDRDLGIVAIDLTSGDRTPLRDSSQPLNLTTFVHSIAFSNVAGELVLIEEESFQTSIVKEEPSTGERVLFAN